MDLSIPSGNEQTENDNGDDKDNVYGEVIEMPMM